MDRIQVALEKANKKTIKQLKPVGPKGLQQGDVSYTQTKTHTVDPDILRERRIVAMYKYDPMYDVFRMLRTKILRQLRENNWNSFGVTAPTPEAGKSLIAVNLAIAMAMEVNQTILLVDMDLRYPKIHWFFDLIVEQGLYDYVTSDIPLADLLINPGFERLVILPGKGSVKHSSELLSGPKVKKMIEEIKSRYQSRIIIFDLPPLLTSDDVLACAEYYDAILLVVEEGGNKPEDVTRALAMLSGSHLLGTVLNKAEQPLEHQSY